MTQPLVVADDRVVLFHYVLKDDAGAVIDASGEHPLAYLHGHGNIVPGLERQLVGLAVGAEVHAVVPPGEAYGEYNEDAVERVHRSALPKGLEPQPGMPLRFRSDDGQIATVFVVEAKGAWVTLTSNHPLAGQTLHFDIVIDAIREASAEEIAHGHAHGPDGHHHH